MFLKLWQSKQNMSLWRSWSLRSVAMPTTKAVVSPVTDYVGCFVPGRSISTSFLGGLDQSHCTVNAGFIVGCSRFRVTTLDQSLILLKHKEGVSVILGRSVRGLWKKEESISLSATEWQVASLCHMNWNSPYPYLCLLHLRVTLIKQKRSFCIFTVLTHSLIH